MSRLIVDSENNSTEWYEIYNHTANGVYEERPGYGREPYLTLNEANEALKEYIKDLSCPSYIPENAPIIVKVTVTKI